jgi:hypothetical protein
MHGTRVRDYFRLIQKEVAEGLAAVSGVALRRVTVRLGLDCVVGQGGEMEVVRVVPEACTEPLAAGSVRSWVTLELEMRAPPSVSAKERSDAGSSAGQDAKGVDRLPIGGDMATLRRRLELVLGGPPGFTTGAKAEMLSDVLREFGVEEVLTAISKEWVPQFDTGIESSSSLG